MVIHCVKLLILTENEKTEIHDTDVVLTSLFVVNGIFVTIQLFCGFQRNEIFFYPFLELMDRNGIILYRDHDCKITLMLYDLGTEQYKPICTDR